MTGYLIRSVTAHGISNNYTINYTIKYYTGFSTDINAENDSITMKTGELKKIQLSGSPSASYIAFKNVTASSQKLEWDYDGENPRTLYLYSTKTGRYTISLTLLNNSRKTIMVNVVAPSSPELRYTSYKANTGDKLQNILFGAKSKVKWSSSNKKVATVSKNGLIKTKGVGSAKIIAKCGKKKYICKVKVVRREPDFFAALYDYNTRGNYFIVNFYNNGSKTLTIPSYTGKVMDVDYKSFDRRVKTSTRKIKPHKHATIKFKVIGKTTWYRFSDFTLEYKFKYDGKTYIGHVWDDGSSYKFGKKWYNTYFDEVAYDEW